MDDATTGRTAWRVRDEVELLGEQLAAIERWHEHRRATEEVVDLRGLNRDVRLDLERRQMVRARQHDALLGHLAAQLERGAPLRREPCPRAVLVDRRDWVRDKVAVELSRRGIEVVARLDDGAAGLGVAVAEQPDLLLAHESLPTMTGGELLLAVRRFCTRTTCTVQVDSDRSVPALRDAGAARVFSRRTTPGELATGVLELVRGPLPAQARRTGPDDRASDGRARDDRASDDRVSGGR